MNAITMTQEDNGKTVDIALDSELLVSLPENPATGYTWAIAGKDDAMTDLVESIYVPTNLTPGRGGLRTFRFSMREEGVTQLRLKRWKPWEGDKSVVERFEVTLRISRPGTGK